MKENGFNFVVLCFLALGLFVARGDQEGSVGGFLELRDLAVAKGDLAIRYDVLAFENFHDSIMGFDKLISFSRKAKQEGKGETVDVDALSEVYLFDCEKIVAVAVFRKRDMVESLFEEMENGSVKLENEEIFVIMEEYLGGNSTSIKRSK